MQLLIAIIHVRGKNMFDTKIPIYSLAIFLALISNLIVVSFLSKKYNYTRNEIIGLLLYENVVIIGGAKILSYIQNYSQYNGEFKFMQLGLSSYGAVFGVILFLILFSLQFKKSLKELLYIFMPSLPLMYAIGKIGCFLVGCCYGMEYNGVFSVVYKYSNSVPSDISLFPIQIVETIFFLIIFIYMIIKHSKRQFNQKVMGISFILCGMVKFLLDFFRMSHKNIFLSLNQYISILFVIIGLIIYYKSKKILKNKAEIRKKFHN